jgi:hypothetical protein
VRQPVIEIERYVASGEAVLKQKGRNKGLPKILRRAVFA